MPCRKTTEKSILVHPLKRPLSFILFFPCTPHKFYYLPLHFPHEVTEKVIFLKSTTMSLQVLGLLSTQVSIKEAPLRGLGRGASFKMTHKNHLSLGLGGTGSLSCSKPQLMQWK